MTASICLVGEGPTEVGHDFDNEYPDFGDAVVPALMDNVLTQLAHHSGKSKRQYRIARTMLFSHVPIGGSARATVKNGKIRFSSSPLKTQISSAILQAKFRNWSGIVFARDRESKKHQDLYSVVSEVLAGMSIELPEDFVVVVCNPCRSVESWLFGDSAAIDSLPGVAKPNTYRVRSPEDRPAPKELKVMLAKLSTESGLSVASLRNFIAGSLSCEALSKACPSSFPPFCDSVSKLLE